MRVGWLLLAVAWALAGWGATFYDEPTPLADGHVVIVRPEGFLNDAGAPVAAVNAPEPFGRVVPVAGLVRRPVPVRFAGTYTLWVRVARGTTQPLTVELLNGERTVLSHVVNADDGEPGVGGLVAYEVYREAAQQRLGGGERIRDGGELLNGIDLEAVTQEIEDAVAPTGPQRWLTISRIETVHENAPYYWWKIGAAALTPGIYSLRVKGKTGQFNAAFLCTATEITYPYAGDIDIPPASFIRFRLDSVPRGGMTISGSLQVHYDPWSTSGSFTPDDPRTGKPIAYSKPGYTPWFRLQDWENGPGFGGGEVTLSVSVPAGAKGVTQLAVFPHGDEVLREFNWDEPDGRRISMATDFKTYLSHVRTVRDHAREHYEYAEAAGGGLYPLTRGPLYFGNAWGGADGYTGDYVGKTLRLLGINAAGVSDGMNSVRRYGWKLAGGEYWPSVFMPYDEAQAERQYAEAYKDHFTRNREAMRLTAIFQEADEPGEIGTATITAPLWRYYPAEKGGPKWVDLPGDGQLNTARTDYHDCVLEGSVARLEDNIGFRVGMNDPRQPTRYAQWLVGHVSRDGRKNLALSVDGKPGAVITRDGAAVGGGPTPFKIVYLGDSATLFLNGKMVHYFDGIAPRGGFGILGPPKAVFALRLRQLTKADRQAAAVPAEAREVDVLGGTIVPPGGDVTAELAIDNAVPPVLPPDKPLERCVREDWVIAGGDPEAHEGFRNWLRRQPGVTPQLFGKKTWEEISPLSVQGLIESDADRRLYYWTRRYTGYLTPKMFALAANAIRDGSPNKDMKAFVALSGHALYFPSAMPLDMFQLAQYGGPLMPGVSDWMSQSGWRWDSHQAVAFSVAAYNGGARGYGAEFGRAPASFPMMHCVWPSAFRAYTMLANNVKHVSYYNFGPSYNVTEGYWSDGAGHYPEIQQVDNRVAQIDDLVSPGRMRPVRTAMLFAMSTEYWGGQTAFTDKRAAFLGLSHEYYQPELINEDHIAADALKQYDALFVLDPYVSEAAQAKIAAWVQAGGLLWTCADAFRWNEYKDDDDFLRRVAGLSRTYTAEKRDWTMRPEPGETGIRTQWAPTSGVDVVTWPGARVRARYGDGRPAWMEKTVGEGKIVYLVHRCGHSYTGKAIRLGGLEVVWGDTGREPLVLPLKEAKIARPLVLSEPTIVASPLDAEGGTAVVLYNMQPRPVRNLGITLAMPRAPVSVQTFAGMALTDLPFTYADGVVKMTLPELSGGQLIAVRTQPAPTDDRPEAMRASALVLLESTDWADLSSGAWQAGYHPEWGLVDRLPPLLAHVHPAVRRAAAEALGRLRHRPAADALAARIAVEEDSHALGDALVALGQLGDRRLPALAQVRLAHPQAFVRRQAMRALQAWLRTETPDAKTRALAQGMVDAALADPDDRVSREAVPLLGLLDPPRCLALWRATYAPGADISQQTALLTVVTETPALLEACLADPPSGMALLHLAQRRADPRLAARLLAELDALIALNPDSFYWAAHAQVDPALTRAVVAKRATVPEPIKSRLTLLCERTFSARLGNNLEDWVAWMGER